MGRGTAFALIAGLTGTWLVCGACGSFSDTSSPPPTNEAGPATSPEASAPDDSGGASESCAVVYVSSALGSDASSGCDPTKPKASIASAIVHVKDQSTTHAEIHVCRGAYAEKNLILDYPVTLRGGYECTSWTRSGTFKWQGFGPTGAAVPFDATNQTTINAATPGTTTLTIDGSLIDQNVTVEGFTITGPTTGGGNGVVLKNGASPVLSLDQVTGAAAGIAQGASTGSIGIQINDTSSPEILNCIVNGGGGGDATLATVTGSTGIQIATTGLPPRIHDNEIDSGTGVSIAVAAVGVDVLGEDSVVATPEALARNAIFFTGSANATGGVAAVGVNVHTGATISVLDNGIYGLDVGCTGTSTCTTLGVYVVGSQSNILRNRIWAGNPKTEPTNLQMHGIYVEQHVTSVTVANNLIGFADTAVNSAIGINLLPASKNCFAQNNTIVFAADENSTGIESLGNNDAVDANLVVGAEQGIVVASMECSAPPTTYEPAASVTDNALVGAGDVGTIEKPIPGGACEGTAFTTAGSFDSQLGAIPSSDNVHLTAATDVFGSAPLTFATLVAGAWAPPNTAPCAILRGAQLLPNVPTDFTGAARSASTSIGAIQIDPRNCTQ